MDGIFLEKRWEVWREDVLFLFMSYHASVHTFVLMNK